METGILIYQSKYGATEKYVRWLAEMTGFACVNAKKARPEEAEPYDILVLCGGIYASGIAGLSFLKKHFARLKEKKIAVFCVGASPYDEKAMELLRAHNLKGELSDIPLFYGRGAWDEERMTFVDRTLCRMLQKSVAKKDPAECEPWMKALLCAVGQKCDWTDRKYLEPVVEWIRLQNMVQDE